MEQFMHAEIHREQPITADEWRSVALDAGLEVIEYLPGCNPRTGQPMNVPAPHTARWENHPKERQYYFRYRAGHIAVDWADEDCAQKAVELASLLGAQVRIKNAD